ncbi:unnamed protein product [Clonostachys rosea f. rosea IK726]|uniref:ABM domain-containing protein n=2 Tax=Bionectria ochroleuca TaxID=29856 RepID=A0A0B7JS18_BIOOC|nr:unnamed protein product [Clonostachys rosea f. rosea IK726]
MAPIELAAVITPKPGQAEKFLALFDKCVQYVQANEPYVLRYELHKGIKELNGNEQFVVLEKYESKEAMDKHMQALPVQEMVNILGEGNLADTQVIMTTKGPGIASRL